MTPSCDAFEAAQNVRMLLEEPNDYLRRLGESGDGPHDLAKAALMLAALDHPAKPIDLYLAHLHEIAELAKADAASMMEKVDAIQHLAQLLAGRFGYDGDRMNYDDPQNADLMSVIDRRRGMPVALGIIYIHAARAFGWRAAGLNTPGHFLIRVHAGTRAGLVDPFNGGAAIERVSLPPRSGMAAMDILEVSDTEVLLRLLNNLKIRALEKDDRARALEIARRMALVAPRRAEVWFDLARLHEEAGALGAAVRAFESCLSCAAAGQPLHNEAALALATLKRRLN